MYEYCVQMVQTSRNRWKLLAPKGHVMVDDIVLSNIHEAKEFVDKYISSFTGWSYDVIPMKGEKHE